MLSAVYRKKPSNVKPLESEMEIFGDTMAGTSTKILKSAGGGLKSACHYNSGEKI
jgi:hypothetical protein